MKNWKRIMCAVLSMSLLILSGCSQPQQEEEPVGETLPLATESGEYQIRAAVLHTDGDSWKDLLGYLTQSTLLNVEAEDVKSTPTLTAEDYADYDILYLDPSVLNSAWTTISKEILSFTENGGYVFVPNELFDRLPADYLGAESFVKLSGCPVSLTFPEVGSDLNAFQEIVQDFVSLYPSFVHYDVLQTMNYGYGMIPDTAVTLAEQNGVSLYTVNSYGQGKVFFVNSLLPNFFSASGFSMTGTEDAVDVFSGTTASCNQLFVNEIAAYWAKNHYGYALERVFGYFGSPSMCWEVHYGEDFSGVENGSLQIFDEICQKYQQVPSYSLVRSSYEWFARVETVSTLLNQSDSGMQFAMDYEESAYSSGTHVDAGGSWLCQVKADNAGSYFVDEPGKYRNRSYPDVLDYDGDGALDLFCGSQDGTVSYYHGLGYDERLKVEAAQPVTLSDGSPLSVGEYSSPRLCDVNGDNILDLVCGNHTGEIYWYAGNGTLSFGAPQLLLNTDIQGQALPGFCDMNGDGVPDLLCGSDQGILLLYYGSRSADGSLTFSQLNARNLSRLCADSFAGSWLAPTGIDYDANGDMDIVVGLQDGYLGLLLADGEDFTSPGKIMIDEKNYKGNNNLKFGCFAVPVFADLNEDGSSDLICGSQEYGLPVSIDSEYYPYREQLQEQVDYAKEHDYYIGLHFYSNAYASAEREAYELAATKRAMASYGISLEGIGANQHTWYTSSLSPTQTLDSLYEAGLLWQDGFSVSGASSNYPQEQAENVISLPFFLTNDGEETILIQPNSTVPYTNSGWYALSAKYRMPLCVYYHSDFIWESTEKTEKDAQVVQEIRTQYGYNFCREDQQQYASAAAYHQSVIASGSILKGSLRISSAESETDFAMYREEVQNSLGVRIVFREDLNASDYSIDASVWGVDGNAIFAGLDREITVTRGVQTESAHLTRINMAAELDVSDSDATVTFLSGGMMEAAVLGSATTDSTGWTVTEQNGQTVFTKYGSCETLHILF